MNRLRTLAILVLVATLLAGCTGDPPEGIVVESEAALPWQNPDTVFVSVTGTTQGSSIAWDNPEPEQLEWLDGRGYKKDTTVYSNGATETLQSEGTNASEDKVMGRIYYVQRNEP